MFLFREQMRCASAGWHIGKCTVKFANYFLALLALALATFFGALRFDGSNFEPGNSAFIVAFLSTQQWQKSMGKHAEITSTVSSCVQ